MLDQVEDCCDELLRAVERGDPNAMGEGMSAELITHTGPAGGVAQVCLADHVNEASMPAEKWHQARLPKHVEQALGKRSIPLFDDRGTNAGTLTAFGEKAFFAATAGAVPLLAGVLGVKEGESTFKFLLWKHTSRSASPRGKERKICNRRKGRD